MLNTFHILNRIFKNISKIPQNSYIIPLKTEGKHISSEILSKKVEGIKKIGRLDYVYREELFDNNKKASKINKYWYNDILIYHKT